MNTTEISVESCIDCCNGLLRGELSAVETYSQAIEKFNTGAKRAVLERIRAEHSESARKLHNHVLSMGGEPSTSSGVWGAFAKSVEGAAKMMGESTALKALMEGEEHGMREYQDALASEGVMDEIKTVIQLQLLPKLTEHVRILDQLKEN
ncbi:MAG TPA: DUF2383 domain-containing protein [Verrucomicrobiales bacterium]|jgi:uncharacterized protein (TIGR02284 family)|nr:DUF2383 domain-containing protein [Verrucomicrobiales bacterium]